MKKLLFFLSVLFCVTTSLGGVYGQGKGTVAGAG